MNTGIQDACNLAWKIQLALRGHASTGLLDSYSAERAPVGASMVALSDRLGHAAPGDVSTLVDQISEIGIHYRNSPIVSEDWQGDGGPQPGDRAPVIGLNGTAHHVLLFAGDQPDLEALKRIGDLLPKGIVGPRLVAKQPHPWNGPLLLDQDGSIHRKYGATSACMYLILPDGYIGYRALPAQPDQIEAYLKKVFR